MLTPIHIIALADKNLINRVNRLEGAMHTADEEAEYEANIPTEGRSI